MDAGDQLGTKPSRTQILNEASDATAGVPLGMPAVLFAQRAAGRQQPVVRRPKPVAEVEHAGSRQASFSALPPISLSPYLPIALFLQLVGAVF